jgi:hypothetical protein
VNHVTYIGKEVEQKMGVGELTLHMLMIFCTAGFWYPVYRTRKNKIERTSKFYAA